MRLSFSTVACVIMALFCPKIIAVHGAISLDLTVICSFVEIFTAFDYVLSREVCATGSYSSPSPVQHENGTMEYVGGYQNIYTIVQGLKGGDIRNGTEDEEIGIEIIVGRDDSDVCSGIALIKQGISSTCNSCTYCGNDTYSFDCSNLPYGRVINTTNQICDSVIPGTDVLFPFTYEIIADELGLPFFDEEDPTEEEPSLPVLTELAVICSEAWVHTELDYVIITEVCATGSYSFPSYIQNENGTITYFDGYQSVYTIVKGLKKGDVRIGTKDEEIGIEVIVGRDASDVCSGITVIQDGVSSSCNSCTYCGNNDYAYDCSNIPFGKVVNSLLQSCESAIPGTDVFFPLNFDISEPFVQIDEPILAVDNTLICSEVLVIAEIDIAVLKEVCATGSYSFPSAVQDENGTISYIGGYHNGYTLVQGLQLGDIRNGTEDEEIGIEIIVGRNDNDICTGITVILNGFTSYCNSCTYCGNETYAFDCSNIPYGRVVNNTRQICDSVIPGTDVFFPFTYEIIVDQLGVPLFDDEPIEKEPPVFLELVVICSKVWVYTEYDYTIITDVCATGSYSFPSPLLDENGTVTRYDGGYQSAYTIVKGFRKGDIRIGTEDEEIGIEVIVGRDDFDVCSGITVIQDGASSSCNSCTYCGNNDYAYDCSNIPYGKHVNILLQSCDSAIPGTDVFFPLNFDVSEPLIYVEKPTRASDYTVICSEVQDYVEFDFVLIREVCAIGTYSIPSAVQDENGTVSYVGGYQNAYNLMQGLQRGDVRNGTADEEIGIEIIVSREENDVCSGITIIQDGVFSSCNSCTYCGNETYAYDCSNLPFGRVINTTNQICDSVIPGTDVFFPFTYDLIRNSSSSSSSSNDATGDVPAVEEKELPPMTVVGWVLHRLTRLL